jgi:pimeloyl-ACP methyl ester carboxylesterase
MLTFEALDRVMASAGAQRMAQYSDLRYKLARFAKVFSIVLALLLFGFISVGIISGFLVYQALHPARSSSNINLSLMMGHPSTFSFPDAAGAQHEGWFFPGLTGGPPIVVCHGYGAQRADVLTLVTALQEHGFNVFLFDFSGHGSSPGITTLGYRETADLRLAIQTIAARDDIDPSHFGLWGADMGGYAALELATSDKRIKALAVDDAYADPRDMLQVQIKASGLTAIPYVSRFSDFAFRLVNYSYRNLPPVSVQLPFTNGIYKLFIQSDDHPALAEDTAALFVRSPQPRQLARDRQSYSEMPDDDRKAYESRIVNFFLESIPPTSRQN